MQSQEGMSLMGSVNHSLFSFAGVLRTGSHTLRLWPDEVIVVLGAFYFFSYFYLIIIIIIILPSRFLEWVPLPKIATDLR